MVPDPDSISQESGPSVSSSGRTNTPLQFTGASPGHEATEREVSEGVGLTTGDAPSSSLFTFQFQSRLPPAQSSRAAQPPASGFSFRFGSLVNSTQHPTSLGQAAPPAGQATLQCISGPSTPPASVAQLTQSLERAEISSSTADVPHDSSPSYPDKRPRLGVPLSIEAKGTGPAPVASCQSTKGESTRPTPYDPRKEQPPDHELFSSALQARLASAKVLVQDTVSYIGHSKDAFPLEADKLSVVLDYAHKLLEFKPSAITRVALLGSSGHGKSSLINSLLHWPDLAETDDSGKACTSVVTEYRYPLEDQSDPIKICIDYMSRSEIVKVLSEQVHNFRQFYVPGVKESLAARVEHVRLKNQSEEAWVTLKSIFRHDKRFTADFLKGRLVDAGTQEASGAGILEEVEKITQQLVGWAESAGWLGEEEPDSSYAEARTAAECHRKLAGFRKNRLWPFAKLVQIYVDAEVLKSGVVLADLPGLQDSNGTPVRTVTDYLAGCDHLFMVSRIHRAVTDDTLWQSITKAISDYAPSKWETVSDKMNLTIVCTMADDMDVEEQSRRFCGPGKVIETGTMRGIELEIEVAIDNNDLRGLKRAQAKQKQLLMEARNKFVKAALQKTFEGQMSHRSLPIFCVSKAFYKEHVAQGNIELVQASGIPQLRQHCRGISADGELSSVSHSLMARMSFLFNLLDVWLAGLPLQTSVAGQRFMAEADFHELSNTVLAETKRDLSRLHLALEDCFDEDITSFLGARGEHWNENALEQVYKWSKTLSTSDYYDCCKWLGVTLIIQEGEITTFNLNRDLIWQMRAELEQQWEILEDDISQIFDRTFSDLEITTNKFLRDVRPAVDSSKRPVLEEVFNSHASALKHDIEVAKTKFSSHMEHLHHLYSDAGTTSIVSEVMSPSYRKASHAWYEGGPKDVAESQEVITEFLKDQKLFKGMMSSLSGRVRRFMAETLEILGSEVATRVADVVNQTETMLKDEISSRPSSGTTSSDEALVLLAEGLRSQASTLKSRHADIAADRADQPR
ncbi:uncharacterized protein B0I36DRAFT_331391 [Microdochium trichocladiopsis]|uniref:Uncharacterized protein n=1 Tax=Microdochium trichocladiopsis TaxID=1682393 RepID=A0A9P8XXK3_9PEZI|nr:uncharacterized protein B0I36DRAFT_331391 [Microdochium trichocladiopsis]KAH7024424.1 hypothetical protein B0I36DRAFT_331391 [Microdochium trichocladiopsis]